MLKKETIEKLSSLLKITNLAAAISDEKEVDIDIDLGKTHIFTEDEVTTLKENEYKRGKVSAVEIAVKDVKEKLGLEFQGKTIDGLLDAHQKKVLTDAKIEPEKKVADLTAKINTLQTTVQDYEKKLADKDTEVVGVKINSELHTHIPSFGENAPSLSKQEIVQLMRANGYDFKYEADKIVTYKDGKIVQDKLANALDTKSVIDGFLKDKKLVTEDTPGPSGRGSGNGGVTTKYTSLSEVKKAYEASGKSLLGKEFSEEIERAVKENPEFAMDK